ncbi:MAG: hypothetical protein BWY82_02091 [Verrucomicrobia bacterium ADurb.Bin474]|nr:MAG: hypothetical protein BWY82_02091 [Verrucomicrobia bacterium ADurb.Bin474]
MDNAIRRGGDWIRELKWSGFGNGGVELNQASGPVGLPCNHFAQGMVSLSGITHYH